MRYQGFILIAASLSALWWLTSRPPVSAGKQETSGAKAISREQVQPPAAPAIAVSMTDLESDLIHGDGSPEKLSALKLELKTRIQKQPEAVAASLSDLIDTVESKNLRIPFFVIPILVEAFPADTADELVSKLLRRVPPPSHGGENGYDPRNRINMAKALALESVRKHRVELKEKSRVLQDAILLLRTEKDLSVAHEALLLLRGQGWQGTRISALLSSRTREEKALLEE